VHAVLRLGGQQGGEVGLGGRGAAAARGAVAGQAAAAAARGGGEEGEELGGAAAVQQALPRGAAQLLLQRLRLRLRQQVHRHAG
jgi:hypothetical protein